MSKIEWTNETWNPFVGCSKVSAGCRNCYAIKEAHRLSHNPNAKIRWKYAHTVTPDGKNWTGKINFDETALHKPLHWKKPKMIFVNSMSDLFHPNASFEMIAKVFAVMVAADCNHHIYQVLTKHPDRAVEFFKWVKECDRPEDYCVDLRARRQVAEALDYYEGRLLKNIWLGVSIEDQKTADERIPLLLKTPAAVRWLSVEPLLEDVNLHQALCLNYNPTHPDQRFSNWCTPLSLLHWVVVGGESGANARPCSINWIRSIVAQCQAANVPVFVKQLGSKPQRGIEHMSPLVFKNKKGGDIDEFPDDLKVREFPK